MQFLKILFWCLLAFVAALFTYGNWTPPAEIHLWNEMTAYVRLPLLLLVTFLLGFLPTHLYHHAVRWRLRQRLASNERTLNDLRTPPLGTGAPPPPVKIGLAPEPIIRPASISTDPPPSAA